MTLLVNKNSDRIEFSYNKKEKVLCEICGKETPYDTSKRCDSCWEMEKGLRWLVTKDKELAIKWLKDNLNKLEESD